MPKRVSDELFLETISKHSPAETAKILGLNLRGVYSRRRRLELRDGRSYEFPTAKYRPYRLQDHPAKLDISVTDGVVLVGSDAHYWPNWISTGHRAFVHFCKKLKPKYVILNGDSLDFPSISRHARIGWEHQPDVEQEIETAKERKDEIRKAAKNAKFIWPLGNHDARYETRLATIAPEYAKLHGFSLKDHFPEWWPCWGVWVNDDVVIKHRYRSGVHAARNNTLNAGKTTVTGHLHSLKVTPLSDYNGVRFGVDCGTLADPYGPQFSNYTELNPVDWRSGFIVLTFENGILRWPEVVHVTREDHVEFRGEEIAV